MFNWISPFNYDFAIASIPIQIILLLFYGFRRNLPISQSVFFWIAMSSNLIMTISDIISCEMIIFLTSENPDLYRDNRTSLLNKSALNRMGKELWERKIPFSVMTISINNYEASKVVYGVNQINDELKIIAAWLVQNYRNNYLFYTRNGVFIVLIKGHLEKDPSMVINEWIEKYELLRKSCDDIVPIQASMMFVSESLISEHALLVSDLARYAINSSFEENRKGNYYFSDKMIEGVKKHNVPMDMFDFEITESLIDDYDMIQVTIAGLRAMAAELSLDDFGTGAANLTSLINLPIHVVKVDMSIVRSYFAGKAGFLPDLISLFKHSRMEIVVEGIETLEMKDKMAELGCDYEQGYYFSKPIPPAEFITYMEAQAGQV